jgi:hypothetical protein
MAQPTHLRRLSKTLTPFSHLNMPLNDGRSVFAAGPCAIATTKLQRFLDADLKKQSLA